MVLVVSHAAELGLKRRGPIDDEGKVCGEGARVEHEAVLVPPVVLVRVVGEDHHVGHGIEPQRVVELPVNRTRRERKRAQVSLV